VEVYEAPLEGLRLGRRIQLMAQGPPRGEQVERRRWGVRRMVLLLHLQDGRGARFWGCSERLLG
jgi:hypothetical protein